MPSGHLFPPGQKTNLLQSIEEQIRNRIEEEDVAPDRGFIHVALDILGNDFDPSDITDGRGDYGIDFITIEEHRATIYQFKSQEFETHIEYDYKAQPTHLTDLVRIQTLLQDLDHVPKQANAKVQASLKELRGAIERHGKAPDAFEHPYVIDIYFVVMAASLTAQAQEEFDKIQKTQLIKWGGYEISLRYYPVTLDDLMAEKWRESNADWRTSEGKKEEFVTLSVSGEMIDYPKSVVFFTKAIDLVRAYDTFGYQIFEPNVRCELKRSRVNEAIRASINSNRGRKEFKHLNNGITFICASYQKRKDAQLIRIRQPAVINGLQTVKSIHDSYDDLSAADRAHFEANCDVLVRLHTRDAVADYRELVKSTNNQNPMQPRNLRSNDPEQLDYERLFANIGWFYERKEGAWQAYRSDHSLWGSLRGYKADSFKSSNQIRNVDNLELSQAWLSFIGYSDQAIHNKKEIFVDDRYYDLVFRKRIAKHGYDYGFRFLEPAVRDDAEEQAPSYYMLLISFLAREIADVLILSHRQNRDEAVKRLKLERLTKEDQDAKLSEDSVYTKGLVLAGAKYLFAEFCGLVLFRSLGKEIHQIGPKLCATKSMRPIVKDRDFSQLKRSISVEEFEPGDFFAIAWALYNFCLEQIIGLPAWRQQFQQAAVRSRFNYSEFNRTELIKQVESLDKVYQKRAFPASWSQGFEESKGIFAHFKASLT
jgi:hypothetical protein